MLRPFLILGAWVAGLVVGLFIGAIRGHRLGKRAGVAEMDRRLAEDPAYRELVLERLAKKHGARLEVDET
jgi:hypothetical protein